MTQSDAQPWQGSHERIYPSDEDRLRLRGGIDACLVEKAGDGGVLASDLAEQVARSLFEQGVQNLKTGDVTLETSRMLGSSIRMAANRHLFLTDS